MGYGACHRKCFLSDCDVWGTLWPVNTDLGWYEPVDGKRVITIFNPLSDGFDGYDHAVKLLRLYDVLTKEVETLTPETEEEFGNDPVAIFKGDIGISGGYLNIVFQQNLRFRKETSYQSGTLARRCGSVRGGWLHTFGTPL